MAGIEHALPAALAIDGAESWYPVKPVGAQVNDQSRAKGERYILRVPSDGAATYHLVNAIRLINREDVTVGLGVMQGVYTIALILGFRNALEAAYPLILHPTVHHPGQIANPVLLLVLFSIMLLGLRFFWITRNLYALIIDTQLEETVAKKRIAQIVRYRFTITLLHAILFFVLCDTFAALAKLKPHTNFATVKPLVNEFILITVLLLALNGLWLLWTFGRDQRKHGFRHCARQPALRWAGLNLAFVILATAWLHWSHAFTSSFATILIVASLLFLANSVLDLALTADSYIIFPGRELAR